MSLNDETWALNVLPWQQEQALLVCSSPLASLLPTRLWWSPPAAFVHAWRSTVCLCLWWLGKLSRTCAFIHINVDLWVALYNQRPRGTVKWDVAWSSSSWQKECQLVRLSQLWNGNPQAHNQWQTAARARQLVLPSRRLEITRAALLLKQTFKSVSSVMKACDSCFKFSWWMDY